MHTIFTYDHHGSVKNCKKQVLHFSRVRGHSRSLKMVPVDTAYATCYSPLNSQKKLRKMLKQRLDRAVQ